MREFKNEKLDINSFLLLTKDVYIPVLLIAGCSGSGKTTFERRLFKNYPEYFFKLPQITTREKRPHEKHGLDYYFIHEDVYNLIKDGLVAKIDNSFLDYKYGTLPVFDRNRINTIIAAKEGIINYFKFINEIKNIDKNLRFKTIIVRIDIEPDDISESAKRRHRNFDFLKKEREDTLWSFNNGDYHWKYNYIVNEKTGFIEPEKVFTME